MDLISYIIGKNAGGGGIDEYFDNTVSSSTSSSKTILNKITKKIISPITLSDDVISLEYAFRSFEGTEIPELLNTSNVKSTKNMFEGCPNITTIPLFDTSNVVNMSEMFSGCSKLLTIPSLDTSNVTNMSSIFYNGRALTSIPNIDTSNVTTMYYMFNTCNSLGIVPELNASKVININNMFGSAGNIIDLGGLKNLGKAYLTTASANFANYTLGLSYSPSLTHESLMNVINNLYDIATKGCNTQRLLLGAVNLRKLTEEEIAIATNKGWTVS